MNEEEVVDPNFTIHLPVLKLNGVQEMITISGHKEITMGGIMPCQQWRNSILSTEHSGITDKGNNVTILDNREKIYKGSNITSADGTAFAASKMYIECVVDKKPFDVTGLITTDITPSQ
jgi:hypothetical protein